MSKKITIIIDKETLSVACAALLLVHHLTMGKDDGAARIAFNNLRKSTCEAQ